MKFRNKQRGMALIMLVFIVVLAATGYLLHALNPTAMKIERDKKTASALADAKAALIGWSVKNNTPGRLPCPEDLNLIGTLNEGSAMNSCNNADQRIGRLPWRTLGLGDIRDGYGDKLWYALSDGFRNPPINSDTPAQLTVDGVSGTYVAIIFSPGPALNGQARVASPPDIAQYLDLPNNDGDSVYTTTGAVESFNDKLLLISHDDLLHPVEKRVAGEALKCLEKYAIENTGRYPWPARLDPANLSYEDTSGQLFGRLPDTPFENTKTDNSMMSKNWPGSCSIVSNSGWWLSWKELVFFAVADGYKPTGGMAPCGNCLTITPPSLNADKKVVVLVAGKALSNQVRSSILEKGTLTNYLEFPNNGGGVLFAQQPATTLFNDVVVYH